MKHTTKLRVGYVLKVFPRLSETFVLGEILELERQGVEVEVFRYIPHKIRIFTANSVGYGRRSPICQGRTPRRCGGDCKSIVAPAISTQRAWATSSREL